MDGFYVVLVEYWLCMTAKHLYKILRIRQTYIDHLITADVSKSTRTLRREDPDVITCTVRPHVTAWP